MAHPPRSNCEHSYTPASLECSFFKKVIFRVQNGHFPPEKNSLKDKSLKEI